MKRPRAEEQHILSLVADDAALLHVATPRVRFVTTSSGPCYEALFNRIELDRATLALPEPLLRIVVAHEVGHATQRNSMLLDFAWTVLAAMALLSIPCIVFAISPDDDLWRTGVPGLGFVLAFFACAKIWRMSGIGPGGARSDGGTRMYRRGARRCDARAPHVDIAIVAACKSVARENTAA
jgi:hypothetical protein